MTSPPKLTPQRRSRLSAAERIDIAILRKLEGLVRSSFGRVVGKIGNLADEPPLLALSGATLACGAFSRNRRLQRAGLRMLLSHGIAIAAKDFGKNRIDRSRPMELLDHDRYAMRRGSSQEAEWRSFPSGHTAGVFALAIGVTREYPGARRYAWPAAAALGALQIPRRAHFPGDVAAGALVGIAAAWLAASAVDELFGTAAARRR